MYQLISKGRHPYYTKGESPDLILKKLEQIENTPIKWEFSSNFSPLARDFFLKLCSYPSSSRYDAIRALQHPWITRDLKTQIPMTVNQEIALFDKERILSKVVRLVFFTSVYLNRQGSKRQPFPV